MIDFDSDILGRIHLSDAGIRKNAKIKVFADGTTNMTVCKIPIFKDSGLEDSAKVRSRSILSEERSEEIHRFCISQGISFLDFLPLTDIDMDDMWIDILAENHITVQEWNAYADRFRRYLPSHRNSDEPRNDSVKRARDSIFDYVLNNQFDYFFTGTIDPSKMDSTDSKEVLKPVIRWLKNMVDRYDMSYIMIAERHKKGGIHFHGLFKASDKLVLVDSGTKLYRGHDRPLSDSTARKYGLFDGRIVYNLKSWRFGFSTAIKLVGDPINTAFYITKYITKDCKKIFGKFYWHSRDLKKPLIVLSDVDYDSIEGAEFGGGFKYVFTRGGEADD